MSACEGWAPPAAAAQAGCLGHRGAIEAAALAAVALVKGGTVCEANTLPGKLRASDDSDSASDASAAQPVTRSPPPLSPPPLPSLRRNRPCALGKCSLPSFQAKPSAPWRWRLPIGRDLRRRVERPTRANWAGHRSGPQTGMGREQVLALICRARLMHVLVVSLHIRLDS